MQKVGVLSAPAELVIDGEAVSAPAGSRVSVTVGEQPDGSLIARENATPGGTEGGGEAGGGSE